MPKENFTVPVSDDLTEVLERLIVEVAAARMDIAHLLMDQRKRPRVVNYATKVRRKKATRKKRRA